MEDIIDAIEAVLGAAVLGSLLVGGLLALSALGDGIGATADAVAAVNAAAQGQ